MSLGSSVNTRAPQYAHRPKTTKVSHGVPFWPLEKTIGRKVGKRPTLTVAWASRLVNACSIRMSAASAVRTNEFNTAAVRGEAATTASAHGSAAGRGSKYLARAAGAGATA